MKSANYKSFYSFESEITKLISSNCANSALYHLHNYVERIISEPLCTSFFYGSKRLDDLCLKIGEASLSNLISKQDNNTQFSLNNDNVIIATKVQSSGGHTRLIAENIKSQPEKNHTLILTGLEGGSDVSYFKDHLVPEVQNISIIRLNGRNFLSKLIELQNFLLQICPKAVHLYIHPQDSIAVSAMCPSLGIKTLFYHHADHHLALGVYSNHFVHIDMHPMGYRICKNNGIINSHNFLKIKDKGVEGLKASFLSLGPLITCTVGRSNKLEPSYPFDYTDIVPKIILSTNGNHIHIGRLRIFELLKIRFNLLRNGIDSKRFIYIPWVPSIWTALQENLVDVYIASFPNIGLLSTIESMGAGVPIVFHKHISSSILSGYDLANDNSFFWSDPNELCNYLKNISPNQLEVLSSLGRKKFESFFSEDSVHLEIFLNQNIENEFLLNEDELAIFMTNRVTVKNSFYILIYKNLLRLRTFLSFIFNFDR